jgi:hypothetical protein
LCLCTGSCSSFSAAKLREEQLREMDGVGQREGARGSAAEHQLAQLVPDALGQHGDELSAQFSDGPQRTLVDAKVELRRKPKGPQHAQGVVGKRPLGLDRGAQQFRLEVGETAE